MKNDPFFKFVAAIILIGVLAAAVSPSHAGNETSGTTQHAESTE